MSRELASGTLSVWNALRSIPGVGPKRLARIAGAMERTGIGGSDLVGASTAELMKLGLSESLAQRAAAALADPGTPPLAPDGVRILHPEDEGYPRERQTEALPLPAILYVTGEISLLSRGGLGIAGSRHAHPAALEYAAEVAALAAKEEINVVSGAARGIDEAVHLAALAAGGITIAVLAEGFSSFRLPRQLRDAPEDRLLLVSEFDTDAEWTPSRAMQRNTTIAALCDAMLVVTAGLKGGSWAQGELSLRAGKRLLVPSFPPDVAPGNESLIKNGAIPLDPQRPEDALDHLDSAGKVEASQTELFKNGS